MNGTITPKEKEISERSFILILLSIFAVSFTFISPIFATTDSLVLNIISVTLVYLVASLTGLYVMKKNGSQQRALTYLSIGIFFVYLVGLVVTILGFYLPADKTSLDGLFFVYASTLLSSFFVYVGLFGVRFFKLRFSLSKKEVLLRGLIIVGFWITTLIAIALVVTVFSVIYEFLTGLNYAPTSNLEFVGNNTIPSPILWLVLFSAVFLAPLSEELFFRRFLLQFLVTRKLKKVWGVAISSVLFGLAHIAFGADILLLPTFIVFGVSLALVYLKYGYLGSVFMHFTHNLFAVSLTLISGPVL